jgi:hypothetical protein
MSPYTPHTRNICPYCQTTVQFEQSTNKAYNPVINNQPVQAYYIQTPDDNLTTIPSFCPHCLRIIITLLSHDEEIMAWPIASAKPPAPQEVPQNIADDFNEASIVLRFSPKASAALSRRCLQSVLRDAGQTRSRDLADQIAEVLPNLPSYASENLDAVRNIGNFAAHEQKSTTSGVILDVEPGEAEWNLDILETLFDFYYVSPAIARAKRVAYDQKLADAGKPPLRQP